MATQEEEKSLWDFARALYSSPGVEETAIHLQDAHGASVAILLWLCWLEHRGVLVEAPQLERAQGCISEWDYSVIQVLRQLRRRLKPQAQQARVASLREQVKAAELLAERHCLALLAALPVTAGPRRPRAGENLQTYLNQLGSTEDAQALIAALDTLHR